MVEISLWNLCKWGTSFFSVLLSLRIKQKCAALPKPSYVKRIYLLLTYAVIKDKMHIGSTRGIYNLSAKKCHLLQKRAAKRQNRGSYHQAPGHLCIMRSFSSLQALGRLIRCLVHAFLRRPSSYFQNCSMPTFSITAASSRSSSSCR